MAEADLRGATRDFGGLVSRTPRLVVRPGCAEEIAALVRNEETRVRVDVVARGCWHSCRGESLTEGIAVDMRGMACVHEVREDRVIVDAGATWREVLEATLPRGLVPPVLTDYLDLTVGGTLSAARPMRFSWKWLTLQSHGRGDCARQGGGRDLAGEAVARTHDPRRRAVDAAGSRCHSEADFP
ncbi:FAD-binding protein [Nocardia otitidiscaviarum]|uniref:FAD-binding protein n=1 Tax=Nocardia otitidiscaviarum TaxID=1823 RepID=A0A516NNI9_9NOCA|nr:FAD-binding protein [Nocardia otitidiscaviarum]